MILEYSDVLKMKRAVDEVFHLNVHFHDACGGQYFSLDEKPAEELKDFIIEYFSKNGIKVIFADGCQIFTVEKL